MSPEFWHGFEWGVLAILSVQGVACYFAKQYFDRHLDE